MTVGSNVAANIASFVNTIWEDALMVARENSLATSLVQVIQRVQWNRLAFQRNLGNSDHQHHYRC